MGTQDFPLVLPNHEITLNAKALVEKSSKLRQNVVK